MDIHIAPGNHDILRPDSRDIFVQTKYGNKNYPYTIDLNNYVLIIDDSISSKWKYHYKLFLKLKI